MVETNEQSLEQVIEPTETSIPVLRADSHTAAERFARDEAARRQRAELRKIRLLVESRAQQRRITALEKAVPGIGKIIGKKTPDQIQELSPREQADQGSDLKNGSKGKPLHEGIRRHTNGVHHEDGSVNIPQVEGRSWTFPPQGEDVDGHLSIDGIILEEGIGVDPYSDSEGIGIMVGMCHETIEEVSLDGLRDRVFELDSEI